MKVVFLSDDFPPQSFGGAGISTYELAAGMKKEGCEVFVITTCRPKKDEGEIEHEGLKIFRIASDYSGKWRWYVSLYNPPVVKQVAEILQKIKPDVVHVNNVHFYLSYGVIKVAKKFAKKVVWTGRDVMAFNFSKLTTARYLDHFDYRTTWRDHFAQAKKRWNPLRNFIIRKYLRSVDVRTTVSVALQSALEKNGISGVSVVHTGANVPDWNVESQVVENFKEKHQLIGKKVILFGGRLSEAKGGRKVLEAIIPVVKEFPEAVLLVVANRDGHTDQMLTTAREFGLENNIFFTGWIDRSQMKVVYVSSDIVLVPSICFDSFPRVVLEAMASGKPVLGTCYGGASEIIDDGVTGFVINPFKTEDVSTKILTLFRDNKKITDFGLAGRHRVETFFNLKDKIKEYIKLYGY